MGKGDGLFCEHILTRMKLSMCDEVSSASHSDALLTDAGKSEGNVGFVDHDNNVDPSSLKSRLRSFSRHSVEASANGCDRNGETENLKLQDSPTECNSVEIETQFDLPNLKSSDSEDSCKICDSSIKNNEPKYDDIKLDSDQYSEASDESSKSQVKFGVVMSPVSLTEDLTVSVNSENTKFSSVLENLPLVYIPMTRQLTTGNKDVASCSKDDTSTEIVNAPSLSECDSSQSTSSETILNCDENPCDVEDPFRSVNINIETSSLGETDSLLRLKESDQLTCHSFDMDTSLHRSNTGDSLLRTFNDASSLSSLSTCTEFSVSAASVGEDGNEGTGLCIDTGDGGFMEINLHSRNSFERSKNTSQDSGIDEKGAKPKRKGISGFLSRNLFSRKSSKETEVEDTSQQGSLGWKLFGRVPLKQVPTKDPQVILSEYQAKQRELTTLEQNRSKKQDIEVMSTTALILENRPGNLPSKNPEEAERHRQQYEEMVEAAKKKEQKELRLKKKQQQEQRKQEDQRLAAAKVWNQEILPNWDAMKNSKKARDLWWLGIPTSIRGRVWKMAIGNDLNVTPELYEICESRAGDRIKVTSESSETYGTSETSSEPPSSKEASVELIKLDVSRTFPQLCIFQKGGPYHDLLHNLLGAYACYRPDVGYVQGMSFIAAVLLLNMEVADAFICFANLLNRPCQVAFFRIDEALIKSYFQTYEDLFQENMPTLYRYFQKNKVNPELYLMDWILSVFSKSLPLDIACRVWDVFFRDGEEFLFRTALGLLKLFEDVLLNLDFIHLCQFLTKLPEDLSSDLLFKATETIHMYIDKRRFAQVLASNKEIKDLS